MIKDDKYLDKKNHQNLNYKIKYYDLIDELRDAVDEINASDYSRRSLGRFKDRIEKLLYKQD